MHTIDLHGYTVGFTYGFNVMEPVVVVARNPRRRGRILIADIVRVHRIANEPPVVFHPNTQPAILVGRTVYAGGWIDSPNTANEFVDNLISILEKRMRRPPILRVPVTGVCIRGTCTLVADASPHVSVVVSGPRDAIEAVATRLNSVFKYPAPPPDDKVALHIYHGFSRGRVFSLLVTGLSGLVAWTYAGETVFSPLAVAEPSIFSDLYVSPLVRSVYYDSHNIKRFFPDSGSEWYKTLAAASLLAAKLARSNITGSPTRTIVDGGSVRVVDGETNVETVFYTNAKVKPLNTPVYAVNLEPTIHTDEGIYEVYYTIYNPIPITYNAEPKEPEVEDYESILGRILTYHLYNMYGSIRRVNCSAKGREALCTGIRKRGGMFRFRLVREERSIDVVFYYRGSEFGYLTFLDHTTNRILGKLNLERIVEVAVNGS